MYNKPRSRLTLTRETNLHTNNSLASLQIVPTVSSSSSKQVYTQGSVFSRQTQQFDKSSVQPQEQVVFRPTQILPSDVSMKRYNHQGPPDFTLNQFAEKVPIHFRSNKKQIVPAAACAHDLSSPPDIVQDVEDSGRSSRSSSHLSPNTQKAPAFLPGDRVIFSESPSAPGIPVVYRTPEERSSNPDRLNLDRRKLTICPILEGEEQLRLLNYQHNMISKIQHLSSLKRLIFLDLYDNQIDEISGLNALKSLRVLMLGKNRIRRIENLDTLFKLDVLDLHGNQISNIENLTHLSELRVLNLAGNQIVHVDNLSGMDSLAELNLRRNRIRTVVDVDNLPSLQRLFLSFNEISSFEDIACLGESTSLSEISLDGNPIAQEQYYKQIVLRHMQQLKQLDMKRVTDLTGSSWTSSRKSHNPLFQLMSTPGFRSGLVNSGTVIPAQQDSQTSSANKDSPQVTKETTSKPVGGSLLKPKPSSRHFTDALQTTQLSASTGDITSVKLDDGQSVRRKNLSGKPRFLTVKSTNWAVNTTVSSKANSVSNSIVQATQQRQAQASNKTGMATKPVSAYTLYRSYSSSDPFTKTKFSMTKHAMSLMDPLSTSPMFTLSPVENGEDKGMQFGSEHLVDQSSVSTSRPVSEYSQNVEQNSTTTENNSLPKNSTSAGNSSTPENSTPTGNSSTPENSTPTGNNSTPENSTPVGNRSRPGSEKSLIGSVVQGRKLFQKTSNASETESNSEHDEETNLEKTVQKSILDIDLNLKKAEMRKAYWKIIDNKIVKVTGDYSDKPSEIVVKPCDMVKSESSDINKGIDSVIPGGDSANPEKNIEPENESDKGGKDLMNTETISENLFSHMAEGKYDISITRNFYHQSKGVDQVTMIIPKRDEDCDIEKKTGKDNNLENQPASSFQLPVIKMAPLKLTGDEKDMSAAKSKLKTSESLPNLCKMHELEKQNSFQEKGSSDLFKESVSKSQDVPGKLVKEPPLFSLSERSEKLTIFKEPPLPIQTKNNMDTIPETETASTEASGSFNKEKKSRTGLSKSISAPSFFSEQSLSASAPPTFRSTSPTSPQNQSLSPTTPITQTGNTSKPTTPVQPNRKNSGTTMGQSVIKQSFKATPLMLTCSSVFPVVVAPAREEERRIALVMARKEEEKKRDSNKNQIMKVESNPLRTMEKKRLAINNARRQWEVMQGNMINKSGKLSRTPDLYANHVGSIPNSEFISPDGADENLEVESINRRMPGPLLSIFGELERKSRLRNSQSDEELSEKHSSRGNSRPSSSHSSTNIDLPDIPKERPRTSSNSRKVEGTKNLKETVIFGQGDNRSGTDLSNLADLEGDTLTLYGTQSLEALDRSWGMQAAGAVTHIIFKFIDFEDIAKQLYKVRTKFPGVQTLTFSATNIRSYQQINALSSVRRFDNLIIENEGNPITKFTLWRTYVVFRLAHFALKKINDMEVTAADIVNAEKLYGPVSHITTSQLPQARLLSLVGEARMWCVSYDTRLMTDPNFIKMNLAFMPKKQQTLITPRDSPRNHMGEITKAFAAINTSKIEIKTKPPLKRSYSVTPTGTSQGLKYPNGFSRPSRLQKSNWHSTNDLTTKGPPELLPAPRVTEESLSRRTIKNDLLPAPRLPHEVIVAAKKIQSEVLATTHYIKPDIEQKAIQYTNSELIARQNYAEQVYRKLTASEDGYLQKSAYFQNSLSPKLNSSSQTTNSVLQKQAFSASQKPVQNSVMQKSYIQPENNKQSVTLKLISVQSAEEVSENERKQVLSITEDKSKKLLEGKLDKSQNEFVGRAGLTHQTVETVNTKQQEQNARRNFARSYVNEITKEAIFTDRKRNELLKQWPMIFHEMVYSAVADMSDMQSYMKKCLEELEKS